ncbi:MAG: hypothetical protein WDN00_04985 [Limisphaerales bacterium]
MLAALLVKTRDLLGYEQFCRNIITNFANTTNAYVADQVAKACLFLPSSETDLKVIGRLTDFIVRNGIDDSSALPYYQDCKALYEYRVGHYAEAVIWAQKPLSITGLQLYGHVYAVLAMAYWRLGKKDEARAMLAKGETFAPFTMPAQIAEDPSNAWQGWLYARIQLDEATALIQPGSASADNPNEQQREE